MHYITQYTRLTLSDKLPDRFLTSQVYKPVDPEQAKAGLIFSQIEILNPWFPTSQIGQTIINTLIREYYRNQDTSELVNFELALRKVNEALAQVAQGGETDWIGNINGVLCLVNGRDMHISQTGRAQAYLFRGRKINHITEGLSPETEPHPLKTFSNITSGSLQLHDKVLIGSPTLFDHIPLDALRNMVEDVTPTVALTTVAQILRRERVNDANAVLIELTTKEEVAEVPLEQKLETIYLDQAPSSFKRRFSDTLARFGKPAFDFSAKLGKSSWQTTHRHLKKSVLPFLGRATTKIGHAGEVGFTKLRLQTNILRVRLKQKLQERHLKEESQKNFVDKLSSRLLIIGQFLKNKLGPLGDFLAGVIGKLRDFWGVGETNSSRFRTRRWATTAIILFLLLALIIGAKINQSRFGINAKEAQTQIASLDKALEDAKLAADFNEEAQAVTLFGQVIDQAAKLLEKNPPDKQRVQSLKSEAETRFNQLTSSQTLNLEELASLDGIRDLALSEDLIFAASAESIFTIDPTTKEKKTLIDLKDQEIKLIDFQAETNKLIAYTKDQNIFVIDPTSGEATKIEEPVSFGQTDKLVAYLKNLYALDKSNDQVLKYEATESGFKESKFIKEGVGQAVDFAIDGNIYLVYPDGKIKIGSKNKLDNFEINQSPISPLLTNPVAIFTSRGADALYVLDKAGPGGSPRIIVMSKAGRYLESLVPDKSIQEPTVIRINVANRTLYLVTGGKVFTAKF